MSWETGSGGAERSEAWRGTCRRCRSVAVGGAILMSRFSFISTPFSPPRVVLHPSDEKLTIFWMSNPKCNSTPWITCAMSSAVLPVIVTNPRNFFRFVEAVLRYTLTCLSKPTSVVSSTLRPKHFTPLRSTLITSFWTSAAAQRHHTNPEFLEHHYFTLTPFRRRRWTSGATLLAANSSDDLSRAASVRDTMSLSSSILQNVPGALLRAVHRLIDTRLEPWLNSPCSLQRSSFVLART